MGPFKKVFYLKTETESSLQNDVLNLNRKINEVQKIQPFYGNGKKGKVFPVLNYLNTTP
jgi:hypothetical protein